MRPPPTPRLGETEHHARPIRPGPQNGADPHSGMYSHELDMTRWAVLPPTDTERLLEGWPRCPGRPIRGPDGDVDGFTGCGQWASPAAVDLLRLGTEWPEWEHNWCGEHMPDLYWKAVEALEDVYSDGWSGPRHLGWERIMGEAGRKALRSLRYQARQRGNPYAWDSYKHLLVARRERRAGRAD